MKDLNRKFLWRRFIGFAILERKPNIPPENSQFYKALLLRFCRLCIILQERFFLNPDDPEDKYRGIPTMACLMWGDMGRPHHSKVRPELKGEGNQGHVITTSIPYMTFYDANRLRGDLCRLRANDLKGALPSVTLPVHDTPPTWGHCAEHPGVAVCVLVSRTSIGMALISSL